jgi:hypothetical protein
LPQKIAKHVLSRQKMSVEPTTETILRRQISDLSGQFSDHRSQILSVQKFKSVGDMGQYLYTVLKKRLWEFRSTPTLGTYRIMMGKIIMGTYKIMMGKIVLGTYKNYDGPKIDVGYGLKITMYVKQCVCLKDCLCMVIRSGLSWQTMGTVSDDLSKFASRTRKNVFQKQICCLGES